MSAPVTPLALPDAIADVRREIRADVQCFIGGSMGADVLVGKYGSDLSGLLYTVIREAQGGNARYSDFFNAIIARHGPEALFRAGEGISDADTQGEFFTRLGDFVESLSESYEKTVLSTKMNLRATVAQA